MKPTLPEPDVDDFVQVLYTAKTVQRLIDEAYAAGLEEAAQVCEEIQRRHDGRANKATIVWDQEDQIYFEGCMVGAEDCAEAIRSMKPKGEA